MYTRPSLYVFSLLHGACLLTSFPGCRLYLATTIVLLLCKICSQAYPHNVLLSSSLNYSDLTLQLFYCADMEKNQMFDITACLIQEAEAVLKQPHEASLTAKP